MSRPSEGSADELTDKVTPEMVEAGVKAYLGLAAHDEMSFYTPEDVVRAVIKAALSLPSEA